MVVQLNGTVWERELLIVCTSWPLVSTSGILYNYTHAIYDSLHTISYGALETVPLKQIVRRAAPRRVGVTGAVDTPKQMHGMEQEEESTTKDVQHMLHHLKVACRDNREGVQYQRFLVDPNSYSRTVENIFHFSFLIKVSG